MNTNAAIVTLKRRRLNDEFFISLNLFQNVIIRAVGLFYIIIKIDIIVFFIIPRLLTIDNIQFETIIDGIRAEARDGVRGDIPGLYLLCQRLHFFSSIHVPTTFIQSHHGALFFR